MGDLKSAKLMYLKGALLLLAALLASALLIAEKPTLRVVVLLCIAVWGFCRAYYFAFYVIEHWIDPSRRYAGLWDFATRGLERRRAERE